MSAAYKWTHKMSTSNGMNDVELLQGLGYAGSMDNQAMLAGAIAEMGPARHSAAMAKIARGNAGSAGKTIRDKVMDRADGLPKEILQGLIKKNLQIVDAEITKVIYITNKATVNFFADGDTIAEGLTNLNGAKLPKDVWFLADGLQYLEGVGTGSVNAYDVFFDTPDAKSANGDFDFKINNGKFALLERSPLSMFTDITPNGGFRNKKHAVELFNPKWIEPQVKIEFNTRYAAANATANYWAKIKILGGAIIGL